MKINTQYNTLIAGFIITMLMFVACKKDSLSPGVEYMPDMYRGPALETYSQTYLNGKEVPTAFIPVDGTIARGILPYPFPNTPEGYEAASALLNPLTDLNKSASEGEALFSKYCVHCHGEKGDGVGTLKIKGEPFPVPSYYDETHKNLPDGKMLHTLHYGKGLMGSHASQLSKEECWKLITYVNALQEKALEKP